MKLPFSFLQSSKKEISDYYLTLVLTDEKASALILKSEEGAFRKVNAFESFFSDEIEKLSVDELTTTIDKAISRAEEILPPDVQTHQTVFGVKDTWVDPETKKIKKEYLEKLKKVCNALDLTPLGFMVTTEAIAHFLQEEEGAPISAIFAEIEKNFVTLRLLRGGKVIESVTSHHLESLPETLDKLLGHFTVPVLPARIIVFQSKADERISQALLTHHWSKSLPFLHIPQVTVLPETFAMSSVMFGAAQQMGFTVSKKTHKPMPSAVLHKKQEEETLQTEEGEKETDEEVFEREAEADAAATSDFGFVMDQDIAEKRRFAQKEDKEELPMYHVTHSDSLADIQEEETPQKRRSKGGTAFLPKVVASFQAMKERVVEGGSNVFAGMRGKQAPWKIILPIVAVIILVGGTTYFYFNGMQAQVSLTMKPDLVSQEESVTFSTNEENDFENGLIAAQPISVSLNAQVSTTATGEKDVGEKAKGKITIYNNNDRPITLSSSTTVTASNGEAFVLDNEVKVGSASGDIFSGTKPGTSDASVTAKELGTEGNVPSGTEFKFGSESTVAAKNDSAFSGGTKKTVTVVSENDLAKLRSNLTKNVQASAKQKLAAQVSEGEIVLPFISDPTVTKQKFSKDVNDEATQVSLTGTVVYTGMAYATADLDEYAKTVVSEKHANDASIANKSIEVTVETAKQRTKNAATATVSIEAGLLPDINKQDIISNIKNKSAGDARKTLLNLPQVEDATISFSPPIPLFPSLFPRLPNQIAVTIKTQ